MTVDRAQFTPDGSNPPFPVPINDLCTVPTESMAYLLANLVIGERDASTLDILEIGTGSGYQSAILAERCRSIVSIEVALDSQVAARLPSNVAIIHANGYEYDTQEQFDGVLVTFGSVQVSPVWAKQLKDEGLLVVPFERNGTSQIRLYERRGDLLKMVDVIGYAGFTQGITV